MKRIAEFAWPVIGLGAAAVACWLLIKELRGLSFASLSEAIASISLGRWLLAISSAVLAYWALAWYDRIALLHLGRKISWLFVSLTALATYAIAHTIGASMLSGAVIRYRAYSSKGLERDRDRAAGRLLFIHVWTGRGDPRRRVAAHPS